MYAVVATVGPGLTHHQERQLAGIVQQAAHDKAYMAKAFFGLDVEGRQAELLRLGGRVSASNAGRRFGKSTMTLIDGVFDSLTRPRGGKGDQPWRGWVTGPSVDQAGIYFNELEERAMQNQLLEAIIKPGATGQLVTRSPFPSVTFRNGAILQGRSTARDGVYLRGKGADWVAITEAAFIKDRVYNQVIRAMVADRLGKVRLESTPNGENYFSRLFNLGLRDPTAYYRAFHATIYDNTRLDRDEIERIRLEVPEFVWRVEYLAEFLTDQDIVFPWDLLADLFDDDYAMYDDQAILAGARFRGGVDLGRVHDYTVIVVADVTKRPFKLAHWERFRGRLHTGPGGAIERANEVSARFGQCRMKIDATNESAVTELANNADPVVFNQVNRTEMLNHFEVLCQRNDVGLPASWTQLRDEMRALRRIQKGLRTRVDHPSDGYDDCVFATALALWDTAIPGTGLSDAGAQVLTGSSFS